MCVCTYFMSVSYKQKTFVPSIFTLIYCKCALTFLLLKPAALLSLSSVSIPRPCSIVSIICLAIKLQGTLLKRDINSGLPMRRWCPSIRWDMSCLESRWPERGEMSDPDSKRRVLRPVQITYQSQPVQSKMRLTEMLGFQQLNFQFKFIQILDFSV